MAFGRWLRSRREAGGQAVAGRRRRRRRALRAAAWSALGAALLLGLAAGLALLPPVRDRALAEALRRARPHIPGRLQLAAASWPAPGRLALRDLLWTDGPDTLLAADRLEIDWALRPLLRGDLLVRQARVEGLTADFPAIGARLPAGAAPRGGERPVAAGTPSRFPRAGAIAGLPSLAAETVEVSADRLVLSPDLVVRSLRLLASLELRQGEPARAALQLDARGPDDAWTIEAARLEADLAEGRLEGEAGGRLAPDWPLALRLEPLGRDRFRLSLSRLAGGEPPAGPGLAVEVALQREGSRLSGLRAGGELVTPALRDLAGLPGIAADPAGWPQLEGVVLSVRGELRLESPRGADLELEFRPNAWLEGGRARLAHAGERVALEILELRMPDLEMSAGGVLSGGRLEASGRARAHGTRWLALLAPGITPPDSLAAEMTVEAAGAPASLLATVELTAGARLGGLTVDRVRAVAALPADPRAGPARAAFAARSGRLSLRGAAVLERDDAGLTVLVPPLVLSAAAPGDRSPTSGDQDLTLPPDAPPLAGIMHRRATDGALTVRDVRLIGAGGDVTAAADFDGSGRGTWNVTVAWPRPPELLLHTLAPSAAVAESLAAAWGREEPLGARLAGSLRPSGSARALDISSEAVLPGPRTLATLLPAGAQVDDLGPLRLRANLAARDSAGVSAFTLDADLQRTAWLDAARLHARGGPAGVTIDTFRLDWEDLAVTASGTLDSAAVDLRARMEIAGSSLARRLDPVAAAGLEMAGALRMAASGASRRPRLAAELQGRLALPGLVVPEAACTATLDSGRLAAAVLLPRGLSAGPALLDRVAVGFQGDVGVGARGAVRGRLTAAARGPDLRVRQVADIAGGIGRGATGAGGADIAGWSARTDTLLLEVRGRDLRNRRPFTLRLSAAGDTLAVAGLELEGALGSLSAEGFAATPDADLTVAVAADLPPAPAFLNVPPGLWPRALNLDLRAAAGGRMRGAAELRGIALHDRTDLTLRLAAAAAADSVTIRGTLADSLGALVDASARLPASIVPYPPSGRLSDDALALDVAIDGLPLPLGLLRREAEAAPGRAVRLTGRLALRGPAAAPSAHARARASLLGWPKLARHTLEVEALLAPTGGAAPEIAQLATALPEAAGAAAGVRATATLARGGTPLLGSELSWPLAVSLRPPAAAVDSSAAARLTVSSAALPLSEFDGLLPRELGLGGALRLRLAGAGPAADPLLSGNLDADGLRVGLADGTDIGITGALTLGGSLRRPQAHGRFEMLNGVIRIPEPPRELLPARGHALLWAAASGRDDRAAPPPPEPEPPSRPGDRPAARAASHDDDSGAGRLEEGAGAGPGPAIQPAVDIALDIPGGLWLRGQGLEVELAGELRAALRDGLPAVIGDLQAVRGRLILLGRRFEVEQGRVIFYGEEDFDPSLDLSMLGRVGDVEIQVLLRGTLRRPDLGLTSTPEMTEGDIMSLLFFGRPLGELDTGQVDLLQRRTGELAAAFGAAKLEAAISRQLGIDLVQIERGEGEGQRGSLVVGKYLSNRALLSYTQSLDEQDAFRLNFEYHLTRQLRLNTLYGRLGQSSLQLNWIRHY